MKASLQFKKILWAVDAFQPLDKNLKTVAKNVASFAQTFNADVIIAFALNIPKLFMPESAYQEFQAPYLQEAQKNLDRLAKSLKVKKIETKILIQSGKGKNKSEVQLILDEAKTRGCDAIAVATHARSAVVKLFLGSFAESLLNSSSLPVLLIGPHHKASANGKYKNVLFPTDFSRTSKSLYEEVLNVAQSKDWKVNLVHGLVNEYIPVVLSDAYLMGGFYPMNSALYKDSFTERENKLSNWLSLSHEKGVKVSGEINGRNGLISDLILKTAQSQKADLILMTTQSGKPAHEGMGSVTKKVVRKASAPVLALKA